MTVAPSQATPFVEVVSFRDCTAPKEAAEAAITAFELVDVEEVAPPDAQESLIAEPDFEQAKESEYEEEEEEEDEYERRRRGKFVRCSYRFND